MKQHPPINSHFPTLWFGGDYNPEQWSKETWLEDVELMKQAGVNAATVGVFSWVSLEPEEGVYTFEWLDEVFDLLHVNGIHVVLATPSAAPPAWLSKKYPETLRTDANRQRRHHGNRVNFNWASKVYREKAAGMAEMLANRYGSHPALAMWHVSNEYGGEDYSEESRLAFIDWLRNKYVTLERLNAAYWTSFWGHTYTDWDQIDLPGHPVAETSIHGLTIDWKRFCSYQMLSFFREESAPLRRITPNIPITTNMMGTYEALDPWKWKDDLEVFTWDSYPGFQSHPVGTWELIKVAFVHDMYRSIKQKPFLLIESTPSSSNWYSSMRLKRPNMHKLEAMQAVAHGSEGSMYFQWRQSRGSQEKWHGAFVGHAGGTGTRVFTEACEVGATLKELQDVVGWTSEPEVAIVYDWENAWALKESCGPVVGEKDYHRTCVEHYRGFWEQSIPCDVIDSDQPFDRYRVVVAPMLYMLKPGVAEKIEAFVAGGGVFVTTYLSGMVDENDLVIDRQKTWPLETVLGIVPEEIDALFPQERVHLALDSGEGSESYEGERFCELFWVTDAEVRGYYTSEFYSGKPALTRKVLGSGEAWYIGARTRDSFLEEFYTTLASNLGLQKDLTSTTSRGVMAVRRGDNLFILNCTEEAEFVAVGAEGIEIPPFGSIVLPA